MIRELLIRGGPENERTDEDTGEIDNLIRELLIRGGPENERIACEIQEQRYGLPPGTVGLQVQRVPCDELFGGNQEGYMLRTGVRDDRARIDPLGDADVFKRKGYGAEGVTDEDVRTMMEKLLEKRAHSRKSSDGSVVSNADSGEFHVGKKDEISSTYDIVEENSIAYEKFKEKFEKKVVGSKEIPEVGFDEDENNPNEKKAKGKPLKDYPDVKKSFTLMDCANPQKDEAPHEDLQRPLGTVCGEVRVSEDRKLVKIPNVSDGMFDVEKGKEDRGVSTSDSGSEKTTDTLKSEAPNTDTKKPVEAKTADDSNKSHGMSETKDTTETGDMKKCEGTDAEKTGHTMDTDKTLETDHKMKMEKKESEHIPEKETREIDDSSATTVGSSPEERSRVNIRTEEKVEKKIPSAETQGIKDSKESDAKLRSKAKDTSEKPGGQRGRNDASSRDKDGRGATKQLHETDSRNASLMKEMQIFPQPSGGKMSDVRDNSFRLVGYPIAGTRLVTISFPSGAVQVSSSESNVWQT